MIELRASMLPAYSDCPRRAAAKQYRKQIERAGFKLRETKRSVGAAIGTSLHAAFAELCRQRRDNPEFAYERDTASTAIELAVAEFDLQAADGIEYDDTTKRGTHEVTLQRMVAAILPLVYRLMPKHIEQEMIQPVHGLPVMLTGHLDVSEITNRILDVKTSGREEPSPQAQLGGYLMLAEAGSLIPVDKGSVGMIYMKRVRPAKLQPDPIIRMYDSGECKLAAWAAIESAAEHKAKFDESGDPWSFPANPMSQMCSATYCVAHGTPFCKVGKQKQED